ncbi:unnamed protein product [Didymodactylos carnosus]|uniref:Uncharacterized protein n=1 Tax=Didymodactylos carnosus TaxID=1234261 RepID=A0A814HWC9_9BILA|nr:unnamed protein product [Didymodactylos carnosus]CAF1015476.1 unnamed protein product [Didymodactylos carnosus]CAF3751385.1 unnamed protein product [Didymodactylos carnosus]CAF3787059.1 unnamed protein product [Didymodactylos carnosus]
MTEAKSTHDEKPYNSSDDDKTNEDEQNVADDKFVYLKSSSTIPILIVILVSLICILTTALIIKTLLHDRGISTSLLKYLGLKKNQTEPKVIFWPTLLVVELRSENKSTTINENSTIVWPRIAPKTNILPQHILNRFKNIVLPSLFVLSILLAILAYYLRYKCIQLKHFAWGALPKIPLKSKIDLRRENTQLNVLSDQTMSITQEIKIKPVKKQDDSTQYEINDISNITAQTVPNEYDEFITKEENERTKPSALL